MTKKHLLRALHRPQFRRDAGDEQLEGLIRQPTVTKRHPLNTLVLEARMTTSSKTTTVAVAVAAEGMGATADGPGRGLGVLLMPRLK